MTTAATITANLMLKADDFSKGMNGAEKSASSFEAKMKSVGQTMQKVGAGMTLALTVPIVAFMKAAVTSAAESEAALADLNTVIKSTGGVAGVSAKEVTKYADAMQLVTKFSDEEIISAQSMLLTFTKIGKEVFPDVTDATLDMAQKFGMDATQAAIMLGKALNDPIAGVGALRRIGVALSQEQEDSIKHFMAVNDIASAQKVILKELATEVGGAAEAFGATFAGKVAILNNQFDTLKEALGNAIIPTLVSFMEAITPIIQAIADAPPWVQQLIVVFLGLVALAGPLIGFIGTILSIVASMSTLGIGAAAAGTATVGIGVSAAGLGAAFVALLPIITLVIAVMALWWLIANHGKEVMTTLGQLVWLLVEAVKQSVNEFMNWSASVAAKIDNVHTVWKNFVQSIGYAWTAFTLLLSGDFDAAKAYINEAIKGIKGEFQDLMRIFPAIGNLFRAVSSGIGKAIDWMIGKVKALIAAIAKIVLPPELTPGSPTPFEIGLRGIASAMDAISAKSLPKMTAGLSVTQAVTSVGGGGGNHIVDNSVYAPGLSAETLRIALDRKTKKWAAAL